MAWIRWLGTTPGGNGLSALVLGFVVGMLHAVRMSPRDCPAAPSGRDDPPPARIGPIALGSRPDGHAASPIRCTTAAETVADPRPVASADRGQPWPDTRTAP